MKTFATGNTLLPLCIFYQRRKKSRVISQVKIISHDLTNEGLFTKVHRKRKKTLRKLGTETTKSLIQQKIGMWKKAVLLPRQMCWKISLGQSKRDPSLSKEAHENHYYLNTQLMFHGKQFIESNACSLLLEKLCGVDDPEALSWQGAKRIITLYLLHLISLSLGLFCKNKNWEQKSVTHDSL